MSTRWDNYKHSETDCTCKITETGSSYCKACADLQHTEDEKEYQKQLLDPTLYRFSIHIKSDIPMANMKHGAFAIYGPSVATRVCTWKQYHEETEDFINKGGKITGVNYEINVGKCPKCGGKSGTDKNILCSKCDTGICELCGDKTPESELVFDKHYGNLCEFCIKDINKRAKKFNNSITDKFIVLDMFNELQNDIKNNCKPV